MARPAGPILEVTVVSQMLKAPGGRRYGPTALAHATAGQTGVQQRRRIESSGPHGSAGAVIGVAIPAGRTSGAPTVVPVRRVMRTVHRRRPPSGLVASRPFAGATPCPMVAQGASGYRMGRWARLTMTLTVLAAGVVVAITAATGQSVSATALVTVQGGDSLWSIATQADPDRDPRDVIDEIRTLNHLTGDVLPIGIVLRVPAG